MCTMVATLSDNIQHNSVNKKELDVTAWLYMLIPEVAILVAVITVI